MTDIPEGHPTTLVTEEGLVFHNGTQCYIRQVHYDFEKRAGRIDMGPGACTDMGGAIDIFQAIDEEVALVETFTPEGEADTLYRKGRDGEWSAHDPQRGIDYYSR